MRVSNNLPRSNGGHLWKDFDRDQRRRVATAVRRGEHIVDQREAQLALYYAARGLRQLRIIWVYLVLTALSAFVLSTLARSSIPRSLMLAGVFAAVVGSIIVPLSLRERRRLRRAAVIYREAADRDGDG